jgi:hypothetical protein
MPIARIEFGPLLADLDARGLRRRRRLARHAGDASADIELDGRACVDFCSNDYLGLSAHPRVVDAFIATAREQGVGARASHLITGHQPEHEALERELAAWAGRERAIVRLGAFSRNPIPGAVGQAHGRQRRSEALHRRQPGQSQEEGVEELPLPSSSILEPRPA